VASQDTVRELVEPEIQALGGLLHTGMSTALGQAEKVLSHLDHSKYPHMRPIHARAEFREQLDASQLPNGWLVTGNPRAMGQTGLVHESSGIRMRFLKERRRNYPGGVPVAGSTRARRDYWQSEPLFDLPSKRPAQAGSQDVQLLLLWDYTNAAVRDAFTLRVVHTLAPGDYGLAVPVDLVFEVFSGGGFTTHLRFTGDPQDEDLFHVDIDEQGNRFDG
jgi:hypothetical protein